MLKVIRYQVGKARHAANTFTVYQDKDPKSYRFYLQEFNEDNPNVPYPRGEASSSYTLTSAAEDDVM
jgi:hypothetical protein